MSTTSTKRTLRVALVREVFSPDPARLEECLLRARDAGADFAILPELPLLPWVPATKTVRSEDAEEPGGPMQQVQSSAARKAGIPFVGGAILRDAETGTRFNTALVFGDQGELLQSYRKIHIPEEPGFWETSHYESSSDGARPFEVHGWSLGIQICSDLMRPMGSHALAARGAEVLVNPRATSPDTANNWKLVCRSTALTTSSYVLSATRPRPEQGVNLGGPCFAIAPDGQLMLESEEELAVISLERPKLNEARVDYPGYLPVRGDVYTESFGLNPED